MLQTNEQVRGEAFTVLSQRQSFIIYDDAADALTKVFGQSFGFHMLRGKVGDHRERISKLASPHLLNIRHLYVDINSATPRSRSSYRLTLRAATALAHEYDLKGYSSFQANLWQHSLTAYMVAAILPQAKQLRSITVDIAGFLHSEDKSLLLNGIPRLYALGKTSLRILLNGKSDAELVYGRNAIDRRVLEDYLSKACGEEIAFPKGDVLPPRYPMRRLPLVI